MNTKGLALVTVMGFILVLSLLMVPLALGITQLTSSTNVVSSKIGMGEARNGAVELARYYIATSSTACQEEPISNLPEEQLAQGSLTPAISCTSSIHAFNGDAYRYWDFYVTYKSKNAAENSVCFTGSAVEYFSQPKVGDIPTSTVAVYITHLEDKHVEDEPNCPR